MFKRIPFILMLCCALICFGYLLFLRSNQEDVPIRVSTEISEDFSWKENKSFHDKLLCIYGSPYVCLTRYQTVENSHGTILKHAILNLIDIDRQQRILEARWDNETVITKTSVSLLETRISPMVAFLVNGSPQIVLSSQQCDLPFYQRLLCKISLPSIVNMNYSYYLKSKMYLLDASGNIERKSPYPYFMYPPIQGSNEFPAIDATKKDLAVYRFTSNRSCEQEIVWKDAGMPSSCFPLGDGSFLGYVYKRDVFTFFLKSDPLTFREFTPDQLIVLYPSQLSQFNTFHLNGLNAFQDSSPCLLTIPEAPDHPVFEIQTDRIAQGGVEDIFNPVGIFKENQPLASLHNNEVMVLTKGMKYSHESGPFHLLISHRNTNTDGTPGSFSTETRELPLGAIYHPQALDSERIVFMKDNALWTLRWDGEAKQVFPRKER